MTAAGTHTLDLHSKGTELFVWAVWREGTDSETLSASTSAIYCVKPMWKNWLHTSECIYPIQEMNGTVYSCTVCSKCRFRFISLRCFFVSVKLLKLVQKEIEGSEPEWCISSMLCCREIPLWSTTLKMDIVKTLWTPFDPRVSKTDWALCNQFPKQAKGGRLVKGSYKTLGETASIGTKRDWEGGGMGMTIFPAQPLPGSSPTHPLTLWE